MIPAAWFISATDEEKEEVWQTTPDKQEGPLVAQLCGNEPDPVASAARLLASTGAVHAIDINLGCPQSCAERGNYGAFLLDKDKWHIVDKMVRGVCAAMASDPNGVPVFCKMRLLPCIEDTIEFARMLEAAGCALITVHGRQRHERDHHEPDWQAIGVVKRSLTVPVLANGGVRSLKDAVECQRITQSDGVMIANGRADEDVHVLTEVGCWQGC